jgi:hypothetical protein
MYHTANNVSQDVMQLAIKGKDGSVVHLTIATQARLQTLMEEYCKSQGVEWAQKKHEIRFIFAGKSLRKTQIVGQLQMEGGDVIEARHGTHDSNSSAPFPVFCLFYCIDHLHCLARVHPGVVDGSTHRNQ